MYQRQIKARADGGTFSAPKGIKDHLRNKTVQDRLQDLAVLRIESEVTLSFDYDLIINKFVECKV